MKRILKKLDNSLLLLAKILLYALMMIIFIFVMKIENPAIAVLSRTMGITLSTYVMSGVLFLKVYGKYDIGRKKSKPIIYSVSLAVILTDLVTYIQIMIMNTVKPNWKAFRFQSIHLLFFAIILQIICIVVFTYLGNALYFLAHDPEKSCIVTDCKNNAIEIMRGIRKYKKQYKVTNIINYRSEKVYERIKNVDTVFLSGVPMNERKKIVEFCYENHKNIYISPEISDIVEVASEYYMLDDVTLLNYSANSLSIEQKIIKRLMDICISIIMGVCTSPIWVLCALAIKVYDGGSVFFKQKRATLNGREFMVYKFRTMRENVENRSAEKDDDRITPPGKILRKTRLDELPQILNILKGDMSFVGPRPEMLENVKTYTEELPEFKYRLKVKAGLTGYAQIAGKYNTSPKEKLIMDLAYIEGYSIWKDMQLLLQTVIVLLKKDSTEGFGEQKYYDDLCIEE